MAAQSHFGIIVEVNRGTGGHGTVVGDYFNRLKDMTRAAENMRPALEEIHRQFLMTERGLFGSKGGGKWAPLTSKYLARKVRQGYDPRLMRRTGALAEALLTGRGSGAVKEITPDGITMGTNLPEAVFAQRGSGRRRRRLLAYDARRRNRWTATIRAHLLSEQAPGDDS